MGSRYSKRLGEGPNRGALNPKITVGEYAPTNPKLNDLWYDTSGTPTWKYWDGAAWT